MNTLNKRSNKNIKHSTLDILQAAPVIPVMVIDQLEDAVPLAEALVKGGMPVLEITLRTPAALEAIVTIKQAVPDAIVGSGTVINRTSFEQSLAANVDFMVSPGSTEELLNLARDCQANLLPGATTATEVMRLLDAGFACQKFFPAEAAGGTAMLKSIAGPLPQVQFCPTGGINMSNAPDYLALPNVATVGGSWMLDKQLIASKRWDDIQLLAQQICQQLKK
jgi:2-dehydro-3-deoxyphosphogluconate aldolase / (4S)-4-hydroxy-2-oxoglutarate aldolase